MSHKERLDPRMQALVDQALASGDPMGFIDDLTRQMSDAVTAPLLDGNPVIELPGAPLHPSLVTVRVDILGAQPPIWRRLELRGDLSLVDVHDQLQAAFGWLNSHLHRFDAPGAVSGRHPYFVTEFDLDEGDTGTDERDALLDQVLRKPGEKLRYTYDFGDNWEHEFKVESVRPATDDDPPARRTGGRGACPPKNVGGIHTWNNLAAALRADPDPRGEPLHQWEIADAFWDDVAHLMNEIGWRLDVTAPLHRGDMGYATHHALRMLDLDESALTLPSPPPYG